MPINANTSRIVKHLMVADLADKNGMDLRLLFISNPGFSKTAQINAWARTMDYNCVVVQPTTYSAEDICGFNALVENECKKLVPTWYKTLCDLAKNGKRNVLFLDELGASNQDVQASLLKVLNEKQVGENIQLPANTLVVGATNFASNYDNGFKMADALINRCCICNLLAEDFPFKQTMLDRMEYESLKAKGLKQTVEYHKPVEKIWDFEKLQSFVFDSNLFGWSPDDCRPEESFEMGGLMGVASIRSMGFCLDFIKCYFELFQDEDWTRVAGDTIGVHAKSNTCYSKLFSAHFDDFLAEKVQADVNDLIAQLDMTNPTDESLEALYNAMASTNDLLRNLKGAGLHRLQVVCQKFKDRQIVKDILTLLLSNTREG